MPKLAAQFTVKQIDSAISKAKKTKTSSWVSDGRGLGLKVEPSGIAKYWLRYRHPVTRKQNYRLLGTHGMEFGLDDARAEAERTRQLLRQGIDPNEAEAAARKAEQEARAAEQARITVSELFENWAAIDLIHRKDGGKEVRRMFAKDVLPILGGMVVADVRKGHITGVVDAITRRGVTRMVKLIFSLMRQMFRFAVDRDIIENDPTAAISPFAARYFAELHALSGNTAWCFPNRARTGPVSDKTVTKQIGDRQRDGKSRMSRRSPYTDALLLPGGKWTPHDLRRTGATMMTALGVIPEVAEKCLNHTEESRVKRTYQRHSYEKEKREAWRLLGERLEVLATGHGAAIIPLFSRTS